MPDLYNGPEVMFVLFTYVPEDMPERAIAAQRTLEAFLKHMNYSGSLGVHIADDGTPIEGYRERLVEIAQSYDAVSGVSLGNAERAGYGASYNLATQRTHAVAEILIPCEDDWRLTRDLDLDPLVETLIDGPGPTGFDVQCIRLGYLGFTQALYGELIKAPAGTMLALDGDSPEPHVLAGHVRIETRDFQKRVGPWPVGLRAGETEAEVCMRYEARQGVAWPLDLGPASQLSHSLFVHEDGGAPLNQVQPLAAE